MIRSFKSTDIDEVMDIWLSGNIEAHPFVPEAYWRSNFLFVKEAILKSEVYVAESDNTVVGLLVSRMILLRGYSLTGTFALRE